MKHGTYNRGRTCRDCRWSFLIACTTVNKRDIDVTNRSQTMTNLAHTIRMYPDAPQAAAMLQACSCARYVWNLIVAQARLEYELTGKTPNINAMKRDFNSIKEKYWPWLYESPKDSNQQPFANFKKAMQNKFKRHAGLPRFKKRGLHESFYISNDKLKLVGFSIW